MLAPPMTDYWETCASYARTPLPSTFNYCDVIDGYGADPSREALIWCNDLGDERHLTFREISDGSKRIAQVLKDRGVKRGDRVLVMLPRIPEWQMSMLAVFRLGAVALPCITMLTRKDLEYRIAATQPTAIVTVATETAKFEGLIERDVARLAIPYRSAVTPSGWDDLLTLAEQAGTAVATEAMTVTDPSIIYFTSGSTGQPKGVTHSAYFARAFTEVSAYWFDLNGQSQDDTMWGTADSRPASGSSSWQRTASRSMARRPVSSAGSWPSRSSAMTSHGCG